MMSESIRFAAALCAVLACLGCHDTTSAEEPHVPLVQAATVQIAAPGQAPGQVVHMGGGSFLRLDVRILDTQGRVMAGVMPELSTLDANVATIDSTGLVT